MFTKKEKRKFSISNKKTFSFLTKSTFASIMCSVPKLFGCRMEHEERQEAYGSDITYGTNNEYGFDYLRDNMVPRKEHKVQREHFFGIVDEVDSILIDEARTPLIISGAADESTDNYIKIDAVIPKLVDKEDYEVDEKARNVLLTESGVKRVEQIIGVDNLYSPDNVELVHHVHQALKAHKIFHLFEFKEEFACASGKP